jgi:hypothetical protein
MLSVNNGHLHGSEQCMKLNYVAFNPKGFQTEEMIPSNIPHE